MIQEYSNGDYTIMYDEGLQLAYSESRASITRPVVNSIYEGSIENIKPWGDGNNFPQLVYKDLDSNANLSRAIDMQARMLIAGGLKFRFLDPLDDSPVPSDKIDRKHVRKIRELINESWYYSIAAARNFYGFINVFPQLMLQGDRKEIRKIFVRDAAQCRLGLQNSQGDIESVYVNANWPDARYDDEETIELPFLDSIHDNHHDIRELDENNLIYFLCYPTGKTHYQLSGWDSIRHNGILEISNKIPQWKLAVMDNQISPKFHIQFPDYYWIQKFGDEYKGWDEKKKAKERKKEFRRITDLLKGVHNAGKNLATTFKTNPDTAKEFPGVKIEEIGTKLKDGMYIEDGTDALINMYSSVGIVPSMLGLTPSKNSGNFGGTDKRELFNMAEAILTPHSEIILKPFEVAAEYNGWNTEYHVVEFYYNNPVMQTLDQTTTKDRSTRIADTNEATD